MMLLARKITACLLAVCCLLPVWAAAESPGLEQRMEMTLAEGRQIEAIIHLELNKEVLASGTPPELVAALKELLQDTEIRVRWAQDGADRWMVRFAVTIRGTEILSGAAEAREEGIVLATNLLPGKTLLLPYAAMVEALQGLAPWDQSAVSPEGLAASVEAYFGAVSAWLDVQEGGPSLHESPVAATQARDASAASVHIRLPAAQVKALFAALVRVMAKDSSLALLMGVDQTEIDKTAGELMASVDDLAPTQAELRVDVYFSDAGTIVGMDGAVPKLFESSAGEGEFQYDVKNAEGMRGAAFQGSATWESGGKLTLSVSQSSKENSLLHSVTDDFYLRGMVKSSAAADGIGVTVSSSNTRYPSPAGEKSNGSFGVVVEPSERPDVEPPPANEGSGDAAQTLQSMLAAPWFDFHIGVDSQTQFIGDSGFRSGTNVTLQGGQLGIVRLESFSSERQPMIDPGNTVVDLSKLNDQERLALEDELLAGLTQAAQAAVPLLPPALVEAFVAE